LHAKLVAALTLENLGQPLGGGKDRRETLAEKEHLLPTLESRVVTQLLPSAIFTQKNPLRK